MRLNLLALLVSFVALAQTNDGVPLKGILEKADVPFAKELRGKAMSTNIFATVHDGYEGNQPTLVADKHDVKCSRRSTSCGCKNNVVRA